MIPLPPVRTLALVLAGACSAAPPAAPATRVAPAAPVAPATPTITDAGAPVAEAPPAFSVAEPMPPNVGVIVAEQAGATVALHPEHGPDLALADGERVTYVDDTAGMGEHDTQVGATATVEARGVRGTVPNARVLTEARLHRAPGGGAAVFAATYLCGDFCHAEMWLLGAAGRRARITRDAGPEVVVAWRPDGERVAIGSRGLYVVDVASGRVEAVDGLTAPAYAPDGALFARGAREDDAVFALADGAAPRRVFAAPGRPPAPVADVPTGDPSPVAFEQEGAVLRATFWRRPQRYVTAGATRDGGPAPDSDAGAAAAATFLRDQMAACNAERARLRESAVFPEGATVGALRRTAPGVYLARIERPGAEPVGVSVNPRARHIHHPRGPRVALGGGLDFCPPAVWLGPHHD
jgi:hypothetical protein